MFVIEKRTLDCFKLVIKTFKSSDAMYDYLSGKNNINNAWRISDKKLKSGTYRNIGGNFVNVKDLPLSMIK